MYVPAKISRNIKTVCEITTRHVPLMLFMFMLFFCLFFSSVNVSLFILGKLVAKLATLVGSFTVWNMEFSLMVLCHLTKLSGTTPLALFSRRLAQANMCQGQSLLIWNHPLLMRYELEHIVNCSTPNN